MVFLLCRFVSHESGCRCCSCSLAGCTDGVAESILADVRRFLSSATWYFARGIPYRRGYLLHGPPGCGKSSFVMALAGELKYNICVMNIADPHMTDDRLQYLLAYVPHRRNGLQGSSPQARQLYCCVSLCSVVRPACSLNPNLAFLTSRGNRISFFLCCLQDGASPVSAAPRRHRQRNPPFRS